MHGGQSVSVVIPAARAAETLPAALAAVKGQDYPGPLEVVVAAADTATLATASEMGVVTVPNPSGRTASGLNLAVRRSSGDIVVRVDAHSTIPPEYVSRVVELFDETGANCVGGMQVPVGSTFWERAIAAAMASPVGAGNATYRIGGAAGPVDTVYLGSFKRETFDRLGGFDETFVRNQDYEFNHRIRESGGVVWFDPSLRVAYRPRPNLGKLFAQYFQYGRWKRYFSRRHPGSLKARQLAAPLLVTALAASLIGMLFWPWLAAIPLAYLLLLLGAGAASAPKAGVAAAGVPAALATMHVAWGLGFLAPTQTSDR